MSPGGKPMESTSFVKRSVTNGLGGNRKDSLRSDVGWVGLFVDSALSGVAPSATRDV